MTSRLRLAVLVAVCVYTVTVVLLVYGVAQRTAQTAEAHTQDLSSNAPFKDRKKHVEGHDHSVVHAEMKFEKIEIPKIIHQTWKTLEVPSSQQWAVDSWKRNNPGYDYRFYDDAMIKDHVYTNHPELVPMFQRMSPIMRADLFRYLILYDVGGYYADIDVECAQPIDKWLERTHNRFNVGIMVGFEVITGDRPDWALWFARKFQMCQWMLVSAPGHPILARVVDHIKHQFDIHTDEQIKEVSAVKVTGPAVWSDAVTDFLHDEYNITFGEGEYSPKVLKDEFVHIGSTLLLPMRSFAVGSAGYQVPSDKSYDDVFIRHGFAGTWKKKKSPEIQLGDGVYNPRHAARSISCVTTANSLMVCASGSSPAVEGPEKAFDYSNTTKWLQWTSFKKPNTTAWLSVTSPGKKPFAVPRYTIQSANDAQSRDPRSWVLLGMRNESEWVELHRVEDHRFDNRSERHDFTVPAPFSTMEFATFNFTFTAVWNSSKADCIQLSEIDIPSLPPPPPPEEACLNTTSLRICSCCTNTNFMDPFSGREGPQNAFDNSTRKWHIQWIQNRHYPVNPRISATFPDGRRTVYGYEIQSADDYPGRDPKSWTVLVPGTASTPEKPAWEVVDTREEVAFAERHETLRFMFKHAVTTQALMWNFTALHSPEELHCNSPFCMQLAEIRFVMEPEKPPVRTKLRQEGGVPE